MTVVDAAARAVAVLRAIARLGTLVMLTGIVEATMKQHTIPAARVSRPDGVQRRRAANARPSAALVNLTASAHVAD